MSRKPYIISGLAIAIAFAFQPFALLFSQSYIAPKLYEARIKMKSNDDAKVLGSLVPNSDAFNLCLKDPAILSKIQADQKIGESLGVNGTPSTFIGKKDASGNIVLYKDNVSGALPEQVVLQAINATNKVLTQNVIKNENLHIYGNPNAGTFLVEFSDLQCPFCERFHPTIKGIVDKSGGKIAMVYMHYPLPFHEKAIPLATRAECINAQSGNTGFFEFIDQTFPNKETSPQANNNGVK